MQAYLQARADRQTSMDGVRKAANDGDWQAYSRETEMKTGRNVGNKCNLSKAEKAK